MATIIRLLLKKWEIIAAIVVGAWAVITYVYNRRLTEKNSTLQNQVARLEISKPQREVQDRAFQDIADIVGARTQAVAAGKALDDEKWQQGIQARRRMGPGLYLNGKQVFNALNIYASSSDQHTTGDKTNGCAKVLS